MNVLGMIKNAFFVVGSLAGILAWLRPAIESKHKEDMNRAAAILSRFEENAVIDLPSFTYLYRRVPDYCLHPFDAIRHDIADNKQAVRFVGPLGNALRGELEQMVAAYNVYRKHVQVPGWIPFREAETQESGWEFDRDAFNDGERVTDRYARELDAAAEAADAVVLRFQRFQALTELHFFEALAAKIFVPRKFRTANLQLPEGERANLLQKSEVGPQQYPA